jgi:Tol biopolymer transport system component
MRNIARNPRRLAALIAAATLTTLASAVPAHATAHGSSGRIVWTQITDGTGTTARLVSARPDGSGLRTLTHPKAKQFDIDADVSPDGSRVLFERDLPSSSVLGMVGASGRGEHTVPVPCTGQCNGPQAPGWTADGRRIVFTLVIGPFNLVNTSAHSAVLYTARPDGSDVRRLSQPGIDGVYEDYHARYAPDGSYLIFVRVRNKDIKSAVFRMRPDGTDVRQLTPWSLDADVPDLSQASYGPTRGLVAFETYGQGAPKGAEQDIATVPASCPSLAACTRQIRYVTHNGAGPHDSFNPSWSPDGRRIAYTEAQFPAGKPAIGDIWTIRPDGRGRQQVSHSSLFEFRPDWGV